MSLHPVVTAVTARIVERSRPYRAAYLQRLENTRQKGVQRSTLSCTNLAHGFAASPANDKLIFEAAGRAIGRHRICLQRHAVGASAL